MRLIIRLYCQLQIVDRPGQRANDWPGLGKMTTSHLLNCQNALQQGVLRELT